MNLSDICIKMNLVTVEDLKCYTVPELIYRLADKLNECVTTVNEIMSKGVSQAVAEQLLAWKEDGTLTSLINEELFQELNKKLDEVRHLSVKDFGAKGDGVTDDTESIDQCLTQARVQGKVAYFPKGTYMVHRNWKFNNDTPVMIEGESHLNTRIDLIKGYQLEDYYLFDFEDCNKVMCKNISSNLGFQLISSKTYFEGEKAWKLKLRKKDVYLENCIADGAFVEQGYQLYLNSPCPDSYDRFSSPEYQRYPLEITNGSGYNAININNFATNEDGSIASPQDNSAIGIVDSVTNSTGVIFIDMMGPGRSFERYVSRNSDVVSSSVREGTVWEVHRNGHLAIGCSVDESEYGWNTVKLRDNSPSIRLIDAINNNTIFDIGVVHQDWGDEFYFKRGNKAVKFWFDSNDKIHLSGIDGGVDGGVTINQDSTSNYDTSLKISRGDATCGIGIDSDGNLRKYFSDGQANHYENGKLGSHILINRLGATSDRPTLTDSWTDKGVMYFDTTINKAIWWVGTHWVDANGVRV